MFQYPARNARWGGDMITIPPSHLNPADVRLVERTILDEFRRLRLRGSKTVKPKNCCMQGFADLTGRPFANDQRKAAIDPRSRKRNHPSSSREWQGHLMHRKWLLLLAILH